MASIYEAIGSVPKTAKIKTNSKKAKKTLKCSPWKKMLNFSSRLVNY